MIGFIYEFIGRCDRARVTPDETHIDAFLNQYDRTDLRNSFIKFCFYNWEDRKNDKKMSELFNIVS